MYSIHNSTYLALANTQYTADILVKHFKTLQEDWASLQSSKFQRLRLLQHGNISLIQKGAHREISAQ